VLTFFKNSTPSLKCWILALIHLACDCVSMKVDYD